MELQKEEVTKTTNYATNTTTLTCSCNTFSS